MNRFSFNFTDLNVIEAKKNLHKIFTIDMVIMQEHHINTVHMCFACIILYNVAQRFCIQIFLPDYIDMHIDREIESLRIFICTQTNKVVCGYIIYIYI